ncbi:hypothetical protein Tco_1509591 [Tanacetum coccineum]
MTNSLSVESHIKARSKDNSMHLRPQGNQLVTSTQKEELLLSQRCIYTPDFGSQDIEEHADFLLVARKVINLKRLKNCLAFNGLLRMFTRSVVIKGVCEDLQLGVNKDKKNRLMRIDELHEFSDGTLDDVRTALNDHLKGIRMEYLPQTFWSQRDKANARAMIQAIDKRLKNMEDHAELLE